ncbi:unnamed protein product, partial [Ostreobium quekettii]
MKVQLQLFYDGSLLISYINHAPEAPCQAAFGIFSGSPVSFDEAIFNAESPAYVSGDISNADTGVEFSEETFEVVPAPSLGDIDAGSSQGKPEPKGLSVEANPSLVALGGTFTAGSFPFVNSSVAFTPLSDGEATGVEYSTCTIPDVRQSGDLFALEAEAERDYAAIILQGHNTFPFFGRNYSRVFAHKNGYIFFDEDDPRSLGSDSCLLATEGSPPLINAFCSNYSELLFPADN